MVPFGYRVSWVQSAKPRKKMILEDTFPTEVNYEGLINFFACVSNALNTKEAVSRILKELFHSKGFKNSFYDGAEFGSLLD